MDGLVMSGSRAGEPFGARRPTRRRAILLASASVLVIASLTAAFLAIVRPWSSSDCVDNRKGIPSSGAYAGATVSGTADLGSLENSVGTLAIYRDYFTPNQVDYAITRVRANLAAGRLPWISFMVPYSWADMAAGKGDPWVEDLANKLAKLGGPVWLAFHHEPEADGPIQDWKRMQQHLAPIIHARTNNVAFTVILIAWADFFGPEKYRLDSIWPGDQYVDILGMDLYNEYGAKPGQQMLDPMKYFRIIGRWARMHHVKWGIAETGITEAGSRVDRSWLQQEYRGMVSKGGVALTYFDSSRNSIADWTLDTPGKLIDFDHIVSQSIRICG
jgi:hypothetical protein